MNIIKAQVKNNLKIILTIEVKVLSILPKVFHIKDNLD